MIAVIAFAPEFISIVPITCPGWCVLVRSDIAQNGML